MLQLTVGEVQSYNVGSIPISRSTLDYPPIFYSVVLGVPMLSAALVLLASLIFWCYMRRKYGAIQRTLDGRHLYRNMYLYSQRGKGRMKGKGRWWAQGLQMPMIPRVRTPTSSPIGSQQWSQSQERTPSNETSSLSHLRFREPYFAFLSDSVLDLPRYRQSSSSGDETRDLRSRGLRNGPIRFTGRVRYQSHGGPGIRSDWTPRSRSSGSGSSPLSAGYHQGSQEATLGINRMLPGGDGAFRRGIWHRMVNPN